MFSSRQKKNVFHDDCTIVVDNFRERLVLHLNNRGYEVIECYPKDNGDFMIIQDKKTESMRQKVITTKDVIATLRLFGLRY